jgi:hypothetical protein
VRLLEPLLLVRRRSLQLVLLLVQVELLAQSMQHCYGQLDHQLHCPSPLA